MMKPIQAFRCSHCKKMFMTDKHYCKQDPELKNCFSCKYLQGWEENERFDGACSPRLPNYPSCTAADPNPLDTDIEQLKRANYNLNCPGWQQKTK